MFKVGDFVIYGNNGVYKVEDIGPLKVSGASKERVYYALSSVYISGNKLFTPVDNERVIIRPVVTEEEAYALIKDIKNIEILPVENGKDGEMIYKDSINTCDCRELVKIIKTVNLRKESRIAEGKKLVVSDEKYLKLAQDNLIGELAISLKMKKEEVVQFIQASID